MTRKPRAQADPFEHEIELALEPGAFISERACPSFVSGLDELGARIGTLTRTDPIRAITLYETLLAGCYEKAGELDDSGGDFGQFVVDLLVVGSRPARRRAPTRATPPPACWPGWTTIPTGSATASRGTPPGRSTRPLAAFVKQIRARFDAAADGPLGERPEHIRRRSGEALRTLYLAQKDVAAYVSLAEQTGLNPADCHAIATMLAAGRKQEDALAWVGRGITLAEKAKRGSMAAYDLAELRRSLLTRLGRGDEAREHAWNDYRRHPSKYTYADLMKLVPKPERSKWRERAIEEAKGADLHSLMELLLETRDVERLADLVRRSTDAALEGVSHYVTEPAAKKLEKTHADVAARLWRAQGMRILEAKKSKYYDAALANLERARRCYERAGLGSDWEKTGGSVPSRRSAA